MHQQATQSLRNTQDTGNAEIDSAIGMTDSELAAHGFAKIEAFTRTSAAIKGNAARARRAREKAKERGTCQLNIMAPEVAHSAIKDMAKKLQTGMPLIEVLQTVLADETKTATQSQELMHGKVALAVDTIRRWLIKVFGTVWPHRP